MLDNVVIYDYLVAMKAVGIAKLKTNLSKHLRDVRHGHPVVVVDRETPVARIVPYEKEGESLVIRHPLRRYASLQDVPVPPPAKLEVDIVSLLIAERESDR